MLWKGMAGGSWTELVQQWGVSQVVTWIEMIFGPHNSTKLSVRQCENTLTKISLSLIFDGVRVCQGHCGNGENIAFGLTSAIEMIFDDFTKLILINNKKWNLRSLVAVGH